MLLLAALTALVVCAGNTQPFLLALPLNILPGQAKAVASHLMAAGQKATKWG
jgi:hypothetical protein